MVTARREEMADKDSRNRDRTDNLLSFMVKSNRELELGSGKDTGFARRNFLTESEIRGNLFTYSLGGHESPAHKLIFALYLLAALGEQQKWLLEEIDAVVGGQQDWQSEGLFMEMFPRLKRCQAAMLETLRLYPSVTVLPSVLAQHPQQSQLATHSGPRAYLPVFGNPIAGPNQQDQTLATSKLKPRRKVHFFPGARESVFVRGNDSLKLALLPLL
ncbi:putative cytochrome P450 cyp-13B1 [Colletotrichum sidae]|uniref:Putative cytochrome P450 cyp-13B1 n=1 Tax=Colletotrichum sidae TaxID=1347389 RepID=A0A4R8T9W3_9PEZI|nr:putative cytochrome P450 cyp-13B1 [Colletotrichum sidae]